jgi:hypothetical protein
MAVGKMTKSRLAGTNLRTRVTETCLGAFVWSWIRLNLPRKGTSIYKKREPDGLRSTKKCNKSIHYCLMLTNFLQFADIASPDLA